MKVRPTIAGTVLSVRMTAVGCGAMAILGSAALSACSSGSPTTPTVPSFTATITGSASPSASASASPSASPSPSDSPSASPSASTSPTPIPSPTLYPTAAPVTGGGGTAGVQDVMLFGLGGAAVLVGAGSIAYRRKLTRNR